MTYYDSRKVKNRLRELISRVTGSFQLLAKYCKILRGYGDGEKVRNPSKIVHEGGGSNLFAIVELPRGDGGGRRMIKSLPDVLFLSISLKKAILPPPHRTTEDSDSD